MRFGIKETKQTLIEGDIIVFIENPKILQLDLISRYNKVEG